MNSRIQALLSNSVGEANVQGILFAGAQVITLKKKKLRKDKRRKGKCCRVRCDTIKLSNKTS